MVKAFFEISLVKLDYGFKQHAETSLVARLLLVFKLLFTGLDRIDCIFQLTFSQIVEAHRDEVVRSKPRHHICLLDQLETKLKVATTLFGVLLSLNQVELVTGQRIHRLDSLLLIFEEVSLLDP